MDAWFALGLREAAERIGRGELTSAALAASCVRRTAELEPVIRAWEWFDADRLVRLARAADRRREADRARASARPADPLSLSERGRLWEFPWA